MGEGVSGFHCRVHGGAVVERKHLKQNLFKTFTEFTLNGVGLIEVPFEATELVSLNAWEMILTIVSRPQKRTGG